METSNEVEDNEVKEQTRPSRKIFSGRKKPSSQPMKSSQSSEREVDQPMLKLGVNNEPFNVVEPVKWLIRKTYAFKME